MVQTRFQNVFVEDTDIYLKTKTNKIIKLSQWVDNVGYYQVVFRLEGKRKYIRVHRLIAETLLPNPNNLPQINHIDGNKLNNSLDNLEWISNAANTQHGYDNNLYHNHHRSHKIVAIDKQTREELEFKSIRYCAEQLGLNRKTITAILKEQKSNNYPYEFSYR